MYKLSRRKRDLISVRMPARNFALDALTVNKLRWFLCVEQDGQTKNDEQQKEPMLYKRACHKFSSCSYKRIACWFSLSQICRDKNFESVFDSERQRRGIFIAMFRHFTQAPAERNGTEAAPPELGISWRRGGYKYSAPLALIAKLTRLLLLAVVFQLLSPFPLQHKRRPVIRRLPLLLLPHLDLSGA